MLRDEIFLMNTLINLKNRYKVIKVSTIYYNYIKFRENKKSSASFNFLRLLCALFVLLISLVSIENNTQDQFIRYCVLNLITIGHRTKIYIIPLLWLFFHDKARTFCTEKCRRVLSNYFNHN